MPVIVITPKRNLILIYFAKIYIIGGNSKYFMIS